MDGVDGGRQRQPLIDLTAGKHMYIRNTSETQTEFSNGSTHYYQFNFTDAVEAYGNTNSLLCRNANSVITVYNYCYYHLFYNCSSLVTAPALPATTLAIYCYNSMFTNCTSLIIAPNLPATTLANYCYYTMFYGCTQLQEIRTQMTDISALFCLNYWVYNTHAQGNFYCPAELTIPTGVSGIPSGWTRHDI